MPVSQIVGVVLRLIAINWLFTGVSLGLTNLGQVVGMPGHSIMLSTSLLLLPVCLIALAFLIWWFAGGIGRVVAGASDPVLLNGSLKREDLFAVGILVIGLWVALTYMGNAFTWLHYMMLTSRKSLRGEGGDTATLNEAIRVIVPCVMGLMMALNAVPLGRRLARVGPADGPVVES